MCARMCRSRWRIETERDQDTMCAMPVEVDEHARPVIVREEDPSAQTIVINEDGSRSVFDEAIVESLIEMEEVPNWIDALTDRVSAAPTSAVAGAAEGGAANEGPGNVRPPGEL